MTFKGEWSERLQRHTIVEDSVRSIYDNRRKLRKCTVCGRKAIRNSGPCGVKCPEGRMWDLRSDTEGEEE